MILLAAEIYMAIYFLDLYFHLAASEFLRIFIIKSSVVHPVILFS